MVTQLDLHLDASFRLTIGMNGPGPLLRFRANYFDGRF